MFNTLYSNNFLPTEKSALRAAVAAMTAAYVAKGGKIRVVKPTSRAINRRAVPANPLQA